MTAFDRAGIVAYAGGVETDSWRVGYVDGENLVVALPFTTTAEGAAALTFQITLAYNINNPTTTATGEKLAFAITAAGSDAYKNYNGAGDGSVVFTANDYATNYYDISGELEKILLPNTDYVLWLFPNYTGMNISTSLSYNSSSERTYELTGAAGVVWIDTGDAVVAALCYIDDGTNWLYAIPWIDTTSDSDIVVVDDGDGNIAVTYAAATVTDDGDGNVVLEAADLTATDDGSGNITLT